MFFLFCGSNNDLNVFDRSHFVHNMVTSESRDMSFQVNRSNYNRYYLLTNRIHLKWVCFIQNIHESQQKKYVYFAERQ